MTDNNKKAVDPDLVAAIKAQVIEEMKDERTRKMEESKMAREQQKEEYTAYITKMKESSEPWVDVTGWSETEEGVKVELEWNDAFVDYLKGNGVTGANDDQIIQRYITLLLRDMADQMDEELTEDGEFN